MLENKPKLFKAKGRIATDILGRSKYTTYEEALNEAVSNSMDWYARNIRIRIGDNFIEVEDDGSGMSERTLVDKYFGLGEENPDPDKKGQFGIGICANAALGNTLKVETHEDNVEYGVEAEIDFIKLESDYLGEYIPESWNTRKVFPNEHHGTKVRIERLRWRDVSEKEIVEYLRDKHWPALIDPDINLSINVGGAIVKAEEPKFGKKFEFDSLRTFNVGKRFVPPQPDLECGVIKGVFYLIDGCEYPSVDVYVKNQRLDAYSGDKVDWLSIKDLRSPKGFQSELKGIIKVEAETKSFEEERDPLLLVKNPGQLIIKSDRSRFFENMRSFEQLCAYLNERSNGPVLHLPHGGVLRLINQEWYAKKATDYEKNISIVQKQIEEIKPDITRVLKGAEAYRRVSEYGEEKIKPKKRNEEQLDRPPSKPENSLLRCNQCGKINRIPKTALDEWRLGNSNDKQKFRSIWKCISCGKGLDPVEDRYQKESPTAKTGNVLAKVDLGIGKLKTIVPGLLNERGPRSVYNLDDEIITINVQHSLLVYSLKISPEALRANILDSVIFSVSLEIANEIGKDFQKVYNDISANISRIVEESAYEEAFEKFM